MESSAHSTCRRSGTPFSAPRRSPQYQPGTTVLSPPRAAGGMAGVASAAGSSRLLRAQDVQRHPARGGLLVADRDRRDHRHTARRPLRPRRDRHRRGRLRRLPLRDGRDAAPDAAGAGRTRSGCSCCGYSGINRAPKPCSTGSRSAGASAGRCCSSPARTWRCGPLIPATCWRSSAAACGTSMSRGPISCPTALPASTWRATRTAASGQRCLLCERDLEGHPRRAPQARGRRRHGPARVQ